MTASEYVKASMRTNDGKGTDRLINALTKSIINSCEVVNSDSKDNVKDLGGIINACLGLSGEVGEFNDMIKKWIFHEKPLEEEHAKKELGDVMWYVAMMCHSFGWDMDEILQMNVDKLKARYPGGFDVNKANNRKEGDV